MKRAAHAVLPLLVLSLCLVLAGVVCGAETSLKLLSIDYQIYAPPETGA